MSEEQTASRLTGKLLADYATALAASATDYAYENQEKWPEAAGWIAVLANCVEQLLEAEAEHTLDAEERRI